MSLLDQLYDKSLSLVRREELTLPASGITVRVRGLMTDQLSRINAATKENQLFVQTALATEDPATGQPIFNPNDASHREKFGALHSEDVTAISELANRLSGVGTEAREEGKGDSSETVERNSTTSSLDSSEPL